MRNIIILLLLLGFTSGTYAEQNAKPAKKVIKKVKYKKTQEVSFDSENIDGVTRSPYGAYLTQKRGLDFAPLYQVRDRFDESIKDSVHYMKVAK